MEIVSVDGIDVSEKRFSADADNAEKKLIYIQTFNTKFINPYIEKLRNSGLEAIILGKTTLPTNVLTLELTPYEDKDFSPIDMLKLIETIGNLCANNVIDKKNRIIESKSLLEESTRGEYTLKSNGQSIHLLLMDDTIGVMDEKGFGFVQRLENSADKKYIHALIKYNTIMPRSDLKRDISYELARSVIDYYYKSPN